MTAPKPITNSDPKTPVVEATSGAISLLHTVGPVVVTVITWLLSPQGIITIVPDKYAIVITSLSAIWLTYGAHKLIASTAPDA